MIEVGSISQKVVSTTKAQRNIVGGGDGRDGGGFRG